MARRFRAILCLLCWLSVGCLLADEAEPWDGPAFKAEASAIRAAVEKLVTPDNADVEILFDEVVFRFDDKGRRERTSHRVFRCLTKDGIEQFASVEAGWGQWYEQRPSLRARVIGADGAIHTLDPATIAEVPIEQDQKVLSDRRVLRSPLPGLVVGAVVEWEIVERENEPLGDGGSLHRAWLGGFQPTLRRRVIIDAPQGLPLQYEVRGVELKPNRVQKDGRLRLTLDYRPDKPLKLIEPCLPLDTPRVPEVVVSTGKSWSAVAAGYEAIAERQLRSGSGSIQSLAQAEAGREKDRVAMAARLLAAMHRLVRYTGVEFGAAAIVPRTPSETLARRYGDCKDQATLLVAMFRALGVPARLALLSVDVWGDTLPSQPGLNAFNHVIVYVPGSPPLWIDPTAEYVPCDRAPLADQGRWALIVDKETTEVVRIPRSDYRKNFHQFVCSIELSAEKTSPIRERHYCTGSVAAGFRIAYGSSSKADLKKSWKNYARNTYQSDVVERLEYGPLDDVSKPMTIDADITSGKVGRYTENDWEETILLQPQSVLNELPMLFFPVKGRSANMTASESDDEPGGKRRGPLDLPEPQVCQLEYHITPPPGFIGSLPKNSIDAIGPASLATEYKSLKDGTVVCIFRFDTGPGRFTAEEVEQLRAYIAARAVDGDISGWVVKLPLIHRAGEHLAAGRVKEALAAHKATLQARPKCWDERCRYARTLLKLGLGDAARQEARAALALAPKSALAHWQVGNIFAHDLLGRLCGVSMDWTGAAEEYRKAMAIDPEDALAQLDYAILLEHSRGGVRYTNDRLNEAIDQYQAAAKKSPTAELFKLNRGLSLLYADRPGDITTLDIGSSSPLALKALLIAAVAATEGFEAADKKAAQLNQDSSQTPLLLGTVATYLNRGRFYPQAKRLTEMVAQQVSDRTAIQNAADELGQLRRWQPLPEGNKDAQQVLATAFAGLLACKSYQEMLPLLADGTTEEDFSEMCALWQQMMRPLMDLQRIEATPPQRLVDALMGKVDRDGSTFYGFHLRFRGAVPREDIWFVVPEGLEYRLVCPSRSFHKFGDIALRFVESKSDAYARQWLRWAKECAVGDATITAPFAVAPFVHLMALTGLETSSDVLLAAAALSSASPHPQTSLSILSEARSRQRLSSKCALQVDRALARAYCGVGDFKRLAECAERLLNVDSLSVEAWSYLSAAMLGLKRNGELLRRLENRFQSPGLPPALEHQLAFQAGQCGDLETALRHCRSVYERQQDNAAVRNDMAWLSLVAGKIDEAALFHAKFAAGEGPRVSAAGMNTLAAIFAERGESAKAMETVQRAIDLRGGKPRDVDWYVIGRIAESYGLQDAAIALYRKLSPPRIPDATAPYALAQRRLRFLDRSAIPGLPVPPKVSPPSRWP